MCRYANCILQHKFQNSIGKTETDPNGQTPLKGTKKKKNQTPDKDNSWKLIQFNSMPESRFYRIFWHRRITMTGSNNNNNRSFLHLKEKKSKQHNSVL